MFIHVIDTETTGTNPEIHKVIEVAITPVIIGISDINFQGPVTIGTSMQSFVSLPAGEKVPPESSAIHHIVDKDLIGAPSLTEALQIVMSPFNPESSSWLFAAHNAKFDAGFLPMIKGKWIDTYRCGMHLWPDAPGYSNQTLRYWLGIDLPRDGSVHRAAFDTIVTAHILEHLLREKTVAELLDLSAKPVILKKVPFGQSKGQLWEDMDEGFLYWVLRRDFSEDILETAAHHLKKRQSQETIDAQRY